MIFSNIKNCAACASAHPLFAEAFETLKTITSQTPDGTIEKNGVRYIVQTYKTKPAEEKKTEAHRKFIDIQYIVSGRERIYFAPKNTLSEKTAYNPEKDAEFFFAPERFSYAVLDEGDFAVFYPDDAHRPSCTHGAAPCEVRKVVVKVPV